MNLLAIAGGPWPPFGGAQLSVLCLLRRLEADFGFDVAMAVSNPLVRRTQRGGVRVATYRDLEELKRIVAARRPDALLSTLEAHRDAVRVAARFAIPSAVWFQSYESCRPSEAEIEAWGLSPDKPYPPDDETRWVLGAADLLLANSRFMQARLAGVETELLYPEFIPKDFLVSRPHPRFVTGICGHAYKGAGIFLDLADAFPRQEFLLVGDIDPRLKPEFACRPNVRRLGRANPKQFLSVSRVVLVPSRWPEPFGRIAVEAMANRIPVLASLTGGLAEIVGDSPLGVATYDDFRAWAERLSELLGDERARERNAEAGHERSAGFLRGAASCGLAERLRELVGRSRSAGEGPAVVALCGGSRQATAFSFVNARWLEALEGSAAIRVIEAETSRDLRFTLADTVVHHGYGERFTEVEPPEAGRFVAVRTWDFGPFPKAWAEKIERECDQVWVYSGWVARQAVAGGIPADLVRVVPLGIDETVFAPKGPRFPLATSKRFRFLFVGAPVARKGADILLDAWRRAFSPEDDVCLVVKDHPRDIFYSGITLRDRILEMAADPACAEIEYVAEFLPPDRVAALYRACDVGVFPYRAEGFCLPILEAMACGIPSIVPRFGACLDFCSEATSLLAPVRRISLPVSGAFAVNTLGFVEEVDEVDFCEVDAETLAELMRRAATGEGLVQMAREGVKVAHGRFRWRDSAERVLELLGKIKGKTPRRLLTARERAARDERRLKAARELYLGGDGPDDTRRLKEGRRKNHTVQPQRIARATATATTSANAAPSAMMPTAHGTSSAVGGRPSPSR